MNETKFLVKYTIKKEEAENYLKIINELKTIITAEGLKDYSVYVDKKNKNTYTEIYTFENEAAYESYDDEADERVNILMSKMAGIIVAKTTSYSVMTKIDNPESEE